MEKQVMLQFWKIKKTLLIFTLLIITSKSNSNDKPVVSGDACVFYNPLNQVHDYTIEDSLIFDTRGPQ